MLGSSFSDSNEIKISRPKTAIILAAGKTTPVLSALFGKTSSAMIPVNGRPIIHWSVRYLREFGIERVVVGAREEDDRLSRLLAQCFPEAPFCELVFIKEDRGAGYSLLCCLKSLPLTEPVLVVLGDTLFQFPTGSDEFFSSSFVMVSPVEDSLRWCLAEVDAAQRVLGLIDKPADNPNQWPALIGVYYLDKPAAAHNRLAELAAIQNNKTLQLSDALAPYVEKDQLRAHNVAEWLDCGNIDMLTSSRRRLLATRSFNKVEVDELRGTITKKSTNVRKFSNEINYYRLLPNDIAIFFPRLVAFDLIPSNLSLTLEYYGYPTLSEMWVFESFESAHWKAILTTLRKIMSCFSAYTFELSANEVFRFYWQKTCDRVEEFERQDKVFANWIQASDLVIGNKPMRTWSALRKDVELELTSLSKTGNGQIIHGDMCFPNILFDPVSHVFKLIDPRGAFGDAGIFGDARYDAAKLLHSINGGYDFLIHEMFSVSYTSDSIDVEQFFPASRRDILRHFEDVFGGQYNLREVRLIEALLFVSMCPLHADSKLRQAAMYATGLRLLNELFQ